MNLKEMFNKFGLEYRELLSADERKAAIKERIEGTPLKQFLFKDSDVPFMVDLIDHGAQKLLDNALGQAVQARPGLSSDSAMTVMALFVLAQARQLFDNVEDGLLSAMAAHTAVAGQGDPDFEQRLNEKVAETLGKSSFAELLAAVLSGDTFQDFVKSKELDAKFERGEIPLKQGEEALAMLDTCECQTCQEAVQCIRDGGGLALISKEGEKPQEFFMVTAEQIAARNATVN